MPRSLTRWRKSRDRYPRQAARPGVPAGDCRRGGSPAAQFDGAGSRAHCRRRRYILASPTGRPPDRLTCGAAPHCAITFKTQPGPLAQRAHIPHRRRLPVRWVWTWRSERVIVNAGVVRDCREPRSLLDGRWDRLADRKISDKLHSRYIFSHLNRLAMKTMSVSVRGEAWSRV